MNNPLIVAAAAIVGWVVLVNLFSSVMHAKAIIERGERIHWSFRYPLYLGALVGLLLDVAWNWTGGIVVFREAPREFTFTDRCKRHKGGHGWQRIRAHWWCEQLNKFDPGHC